MTSEDDCIGALREAAALLGESLTGPPFALSEVSRCHRAHGARLPEGPSVPLWSTSLSPTKAAYEDLGLTPASATIQRVMGSWNEAKEAAGLPTNTSTGSRVEPKPDDVTLPDGLTWAELILPAVSS